MNVKKEERFVSIFILGVIFLGVIFPLTSLYTPGIMFDFSESDLQINEQEFYLGDEIKVNVSWELQYNPYFEESYVQILLKKDNGSVVWNSEKFYESGYFEKGWNISTSDLSLGNENTKYNLSCIFFFYYLNLDTGESIQENRAVKNITIFTKEIHAQLYGFREDIGYNETLKTAARFFSASPYQHNLTFQKIEFSIYNKQDNMTFNDTLYTDEKGYVYLNFSKKNLEIGKNYFIFDVNISSYQQTSFKYFIELGKISLTLQLFEYNETVYKDGTINFSLYVYYHFNNSIVPLNNTRVQFSIQNETGGVIYGKQYTLDERGKSGILLQVDNTELVVGNYSIILSIAETNLTKKANLIKELEIKESPKKTVLSDPFYPVIFSIAIVCIMVFSITYTIKRKFGKEDDGTLDNVISQEDNFQEEKIQLAIKIFSYLVGPLAVIIHFVFVMFILPLNILYIILALVIPVLTSLLAEFFYFNNWRRVFFITASAFTFFLLLLTIYWIPLTLIVLDSGLLTDITSVAAIVIIALGLVYFYMRRGHGGEEEEEQEVSEIELELQEEPQEGGQEGGQEEEQEEEQEVSEIEFEF